MSDFPEDAERLPEGFKRIAYDSDTAKFTFRDRNGNLYQGEAGAEYGILTPMSASCSRPNAYSSDSSSIPPPRRPTHSKQNSTFEAFLPPDLITTSSLSKKSLSPNTPLKTPTAPHQKFVKTVRKMQDVVHSLRRSVTSIRRTRPTFPDEMRKSERDETRSLIPHGSSSESSSLPGARRSKTMPASRSKS